MYAIILTAQGRCTVMWGRATHAGSVYSQAGQGYIRRVGVQSGRARRVGVQSCGHGAVQRECTATLQRGSLCVSGSQYESRALITSLGLSTAGVQCCTTGCTKTVNTAAMSGVPGAASPWGECPYVQGGTGACVVLAGSCGAAVHAGRVRRFL